MFKVNYKNNKKGVKYVQGWGGGGGLLIFDIFLNFFQCFYCYFEKVNTIWVETDLIYYCNFGLDCMYYNDYCNFILRFYLTVNKK